MTVAALARDTGPGTGTKPEERPDVSHAPAAPPEATGAVPPFLGASAPSAASAPAFLPPAAADNSPKPQKATAKPAPKQKATTDGSGGGGGTTTLKPAKPKAPAKAAGPPPPQPAPLQQKRHRQRAMRAPPAIRLPPVARIEPVLLRQRPLFLPIGDMVFDAPRALPFLAAPLPPDRKDAAALQNAGYLGAFAEASRCGYDLFLGLRDAAQALPGKALRSEGERFARQSQAIARSAQRLDQGLALSRSELVLGRQDTLLRLYRAADQSRWRIEAAAAAQIGRLHAREQEYRKGMAGPSQVRTQTQEYATARASALSTGVAGAQASLGRLKQQTAPAHQGIEGNWKGSTEEAIDKILPRTIDASLDKIANKAKYDWVNLATKMEKLAHCLPCQFESVFSGVVLAADRMGKAGPAAVANARDAALDNLDASEAEMVRTIVDNTAETDAILVRQHDQVRRQLTEAAQTSLTDTAHQNEQITGRQIDVLSSMASAQPAAIRGVVDRLAVVREEPGDRLPAAAMRASRQLKASLMRTAAAQPATILSAAERRWSLAAATGIRFEAGLDSAATEARVAGAQLGQQTLDVLTREIERMVEGLLDVPASLVRLCNGFFEPDKPNYRDVIADLSTATSNTHASTVAAFSGGQFSAKKLRIEPPAPPKNAKTPADKAPEPASCGDCKDDKPPADSDKKATGTEDQGSKKTATPNGLKMGVCPVGDDLGNPDGIASYTAQVAANATHDQDVAKLIDAARANVGKQMDDKEKTLHKGLPSGAFAAADRDLVLSVLRGIMAVQAGELRANFEGTKSLDDTIREKFKIGWSAPGTKDADTEAALAALNGDPRGAVISELRAAFNLWDDNQKAFDALLAMTPETLAAMDPKQKAELERMSAEMEGLNKEKFDALIHGDVAHYNALTMNETLKEKRGVEGQAGWTATGEALEGFAQNAGSSALSGNIDTFGIDPTEARSKHNDEVWQQTVIDFGGVRQGQKFIDDPKGADANKVVRKVPENMDLAKAQQALIDAATETRTHQKQTMHEPKEPRSNYTYTTTDVVDAGHRKWIERIVTKGPDDPATLAARVEIAEATKDPKLAQKHLAKGLHFSSADATDGGRYNDRQREAGLAEAERLRREVLIIVGQDKVEAKTGKRPDASTIKPDEVIEEIQANVEANFPADKDKLARAMVVGTLKEARGSPIAVIEYAIAHESKELILEQFKRMDRKEIERLAEEYKRRHPGERDLDQILGINGNHWSWHNWNGAVFSGDDANEIEISRMGVPQDPKERGEVALRVMDQQIDGATWLGKHLAGAEFDALEANATRLRSLMGVSKADIDEKGYIRKVDPATGKPVRLGNFDEKGNFVPPQGSDVGEFEKAMALAYVTADSYTAAVDRIANFVTTALVVIAAVVTTALTGGAAASIWIPVLVTAGAGLAGVAFNMAMKGSRYSRDAIVRDLAVTVIQAATAGIGAAAGVALRGGVPALRALAGTWRMAESELAAVAGSATALRSLTLVEEMAISAGTNALASSASVAVDPAMRRRDDYADQVSASFFRGAWGGAAGAVGARLGAGLVNKGVGAYASRSAQAIGKATGQAELAAARASALTGHWATEIGARTLGSGLSGALSRGGEMLYDREVRGEKISAGAIFQEMALAGLQSSFQGMMEGGVDRGARSLSRSRAAEHDWVVRNPHPEPINAAEERAIRPQAAAEEPAGPGRGGAGDGVEAPILVRAIDEEHPAARTLTGANDNGEGAPVRARMALAEGEMLRMGQVKEGSVFIHPDAKSLSAANDNFTALVTADPSREVAIYHNPVTGEYLVIQGGPKSVAVITSEGEIHGPGIKAFPAALLASRGGHWELQLHNHPNVGGEAATRISRRLPSGHGGDYTVLEMEAKFLAARSDDGKASRTSRIAYNDNGTIRYTVFGVEVDNGKVRYTLTFEAETHGLHLTEHFETIADYHRYVEVVAGIKYPVGGQMPAARAVEGAAPLDPVRRIGGERADISDQLTPLNRAELEAVSSHVGRGRKIAAQLQNGPGNTALLAQHAGSIATAHTLASEMGLVARPDSMRRLAAVLNDPLLSDPVKSSILEAVHAATRAALIARNELGPHEPLLLTLHGAGGSDAASIRSDGFRLDKIGSGRNDDFGKASYFTRQMANARKYVEARGAAGGMVFPALLKGREIGAVVDVSPRGAHRALWEAFMRQNMHLFDGTEMMLRPERQKQILALGEQVFAANPANAGRQPGFTEKFALGTDAFNSTAPLAQLDRVSNRGTVFEAFLKHLAAQPGHEALARPDLVHGELGGPFTSGIHAGGGDQQAIRSQGILDLVNEQLGIGRFASKPAEEPVPMVSTITGDGQSPAGKTEHPVLRSVDPEINKLVEDGADTVFGASHRELSSWKDMPEEARAKLQDAAAAEVARKLAETNTHLAALAHSSEPLQRLLNAAPDATRVALLGASALDMPLGAKQIERFRGKLAAMGMGNEAVESLLADLRTVSAPESTIRRSLAEHAERQSFTLDHAALDARAAAALQAARFVDETSAIANMIAKYKARKGTSAGPSMKQLVATDKAAVIAAVRVQGTSQDVESAYRAARLKSGAGAAEIDAEVVHLTAVLNDPEFHTRLTTARKGIRSWAKATVPLSQMAESSPLLRMLARTTPDILVERYMSRLEKLTDEGAKSQLAPADLADHVNREYMVSNRRPLLSELTSAFRFTREFNTLLGTPAGLAVDVIKANAVSHGATNEGDIDLIAVARPPRNTPPDAPVRVFMIDDKAVNPETGLLDDVKAMVGAGLIRNLRRAITEITEYHEAQQKNGAAPEPHHLQAKKQMEKALQELQTMHADPKIGVKQPEKGPTVPRIMTEDYAAEVAKIMARNNISLMVSHEVGTMTALGPKLRAYGFSRVDEYLAYLAYLARLARAAESDDE